MKLSVIKSYRYLCVAIFCLVTLGGAVRAMNAGLACPDWPLCFGDFIPEYHPQVYFEFMHRVLAGLVAIFSVYLNIRILRSADSSKWVKRLAASVMGILLIQIIMGGLTVILRLHEKVVALHLGLGTAFFALSLWIYLSLAFKQNFPGSALSKKAKTACIILLVAVYGQILLGGLVASHYAALVCTDFPLCNGRFIPTLSGIIGLHVIHRLGAYTLAVIVFSFAIYVRARISCPEILKWSRVALTLLVMQIFIGIMNVLFFTPPALTVLHLAVGTALLGVAVRLTRVSSYSF